MTGALRAQHRQLCLCATSHVAAWLHMVQTWNAQGVSGLEPMSTSQQKSPSTPCDCAGAGRPAGCLSCRGACTIARTSHRAPWGSKESAAEGTGGQHGECDPPVLPCAADKPHQPMWQLKLHPSRSGASTSLSCCLVLVLEQFPLMASAAPSSLWLLCHLCLAPQSLSQF